MFEASVGAVIFNWSSQRYERRRHFSPRAAYFSQLTRAFAGLRKYTPIGHCRTSTRKRPVQPLAARHVFHIRSTSAQSGSREILEQTARPIRFATRNYSKSLFGFLPREVCKSCSSLTFYTNRSIFRRSIEAT